MKKYILIASILLANNAYTQVIIGDLQIESTENINEIKVTNISSKPIDKIVWNGKIAPKDFRELQPNQSIKLKARPKEPIKKEEKARLDSLLGERKEDKTPLLNL